MVIFPSIWGFTTVPVSGSCSWLSKTSNTLSADTIPICRAVNLSAICRNGRNNILIIMIKLMMSPTLMESFCAACMPPYQTINPVAIKGRTSAIGKKTELYQTVFIQAFLCLSLISLKFSYSILSLVNS